MQKQSSEKSQWIPFKPYLLKADQEKKQKTKNKKEEFTDLSAYGTYFTARLEGDNWEVEVTSLF